MEDIKTSGESESNMADFIGFSFMPPPAVKEIYAADKLFLRGKLLPCKPITPSPPLAVAHTKKVSPLRHWRAESPDLQDRRRYRETGGAGEYTRLRMASPDLTPEAAGGKRSKRLPCVLGVVRLPAEMEMKDIKTRQRRLGSQPSTSEKGRRGVLYWGILQSLSCKAAESTAVTPVSLAR